MSKNDEYNEYNELYEIENRYCPICGRYVRCGEELHKCSKRALNKIDRQEEKELSEERSYTDKLAEFEEYYNPEVLYEDEEEE